jgi:pyrimidine oxygenase
LVVAAEKTGREVGAYALFMIIADETDEAAQDKWELYKAGKDLDALSWMGAQAAQDDKADRSSTAKSMTNPASAVNFNMGTLVGSYATVAGLLDELATVPGVKGIMLTFDDFLAGMDAFGERIQPLMRSRQG